MLKQSKKTRNKYHHKKTMTERFQEAKVTFSDLKNVLEAIGEMDDDDRRDFVARSFVIMRTIVGEPSSSGVVDSDNEKIRTQSSKVAAISLRIEAMHRVVEHAQAKGWRMNLGDDAGYDLVSEYVVHAAAEAPLLERKDGSSYFEPNDFFERVLRLSNEQGVG